MFDVGRIKREALALYNRAPSPSTFFVLVNSADRTARELKGQFDALPPSVQTVNPGYARDLNKYRARLETELAAAQEILDKVTSGSLDWKGGLEAGTNYAAALRDFFMGPDSSQWASLANQMDALETMNWELFWGNIWMRSLDETIGLVGEGTADSQASVISMVEDTKEAVSDAWTAAKPILKVGSYALAVAVAALAGICVVAFKNSKRTHLD